MSLIQQERQNSLLILRLNRPEVFNSFNREMALELQDMLTSANNDSSVRAILLTGNGKAFCAGQDLQEVMDPNGPELPKIVSEHYNPIIKLIRNTQKPIIAAVNGVAAGAGANIALACDIVLSSSNASFIQAFSKIGLIPDSAGTYFLPRLVGWQKASALAMTGDKVSAEEAERMGMIYKVYDAESFEEQALNFAEKMSEMPTKGLWLTKKLMNESFQNDLNQQLEREGDLQTEAGQTYDYNEGVQAFLEKRKANFKGE